MTNRFRLVLVFAILGVVVGLLREQSGLAFLSLTVIVWLYFAWIVFFVRERIFWSKLTCQRSINGRSDGKSTLWADRPIRVKLQLTMAGFKFAPHFRALELLPENVEHERGNLQAVATTSVDRLTIEYQGRCMSAGKMRMPGVHCRLQDPFGFFLSERLIGATEELRVLPSYAQVRDARSTIKRINSIPQHGIHQLQRAGVGSELLELREYQPGDPPKSIAWKVSARRDKLMTRQYESEVPVRVTIFVDGAGQMRYGGFGKRLLDQANFVAATIAKSAISVGDPVGVVLTDHRVRFRMRPGTGDRAFFRVLESLSEFSMQPMVAPELLTYRQLELAFDLCAERYPEWMLDSVNCPRFTWRALFSSDRRRIRMRRKLANILGEIYSLPAVDVATMAYDDHKLTEMVWRWLAESGRSWVPPLVTVRQSANLGATDGLLMARELARAVTQAHDNELFVIITDLINSPGAVEVLVPMIKVALARHHRIVVLCPSPTGQRLSTTEMGQPQTIDDVYQHADHVRLSYASKVLQRRLSNLGAKVAFTGESNAVALVLAEAELAGSGRTMGRRSSR